MDFPVLLDTVSAAAKSVASHSDTRGSVSLGAPFGLWCRQRWSIDLLTYQVAIYSFQVDLLA